MSVSPSILITSIIKLWSGEDKTSKIIQSCSSSAVASVLGGWVGCLWTAECETLYLCTSLSVHPPFHTWHMHRHTHSQDSPLITLLQMKHISNILGSLLWFLLCVDFISMMDIFFEYLKVQTEFPITHNRPLTHLSFLSCVTPLSYLSMNPVSGFLMC